jgi:hypothetical protein
VTPSEARHELTALRAELYSPGGRSVHWGLMRPIVPPVTALSGSARAARYALAVAAMVAEPNTVTTAGMPRTAVRIAFRAGPDGQIIEFFREVP